MIQAEMTKEELLELCVSRGRLLVECHSLLSHLRSGPKIGTTVDQTNVDAVLRDIEKQFK